MRLILGTPSQAAFIPETGFRTTDYVSMRFLPKIDTAPIGGCPAYVGWARNLLGPDLVP